MTIEKQPSAINLAWKLSELLLWGLCAFVVYLNIRLILLSLELRKLVGL